MPDRRTAPTRQAETPDVATTRRAGATAETPAVATPDVAAEVIMVPGAAQMRTLGRRLASLLRPGDLVVLAGSLGAGKTTLVQGIGEGLDVRGPITSPTFVIARVHPSLGGGPDLVHGDAYRLGSRLEVDDLDLDADLDHSVTVVEWGEGLVEDLAPSHLRVTIDWAGSPGEATRSDSPGDEPRRVRVAGYGARWRGAGVQLEALVMAPSY